MPIFWCGRATARGAHAIGGMAAFIPSRRDVEVNQRALAKVREDKEREARSGFDGSWVAHPDLVPLCREVFSAVLGERPNQLDRQRDDVGTSAAALLDVRSAGEPRTEEGFAQQRERRPSVPRLLAGRVGGGGDIQPDGGCRYGRDRPVPGMAMAAQRHRTGLGRQGDASARRADRGRRNGKAQGWSGAGVRRGPLRAGPGPICTGCSGRRFRRVPDRGGLRLVA